MKNTTKLKVAGVIACGGELGIGAYAYTRGWNDTALLALGAAALIVLIGYFALKRIEEINND